MHGLTFSKPGQIEYSSLADPTILHPTDVIVRTLLTAICGSDLHVYHGRESGIDPGTVMGHEFIGEIVDMGSAVTQFKKGDRVFSPFFSSCGNCDSCRDNLSCRCSTGQLFGWVENGVGLQGAQSEYVRVPLADHTLTKIPPDILPEEALLLCDILPTGYFCADMAVQNPSDSYAVIGCGPVGILAILSLREMGVGQIFALDLVPWRLEVAEKFGATPILSDESSKDKIYDATIGRGPVAVLEVVGSPAAQQLAYKLVRPGGTISTVGVHTTSGFAFSPVDLYNKNLSYKTGRCPVQRYLPTLIPLLQQQKYDVTSLISHRMDLSEGKEGYRIFDEKLDRCTKVVLSANQE
ncbi:MAG: alcohol dehydrogenase family protein [Calditrichia bacterium]